MTELRFDGRVAVVTGAGRGLGREFALLLARRGAAVVVNDIGVSADADRYGATPGADQPSVADEVVREIVASGGSAVANTADVSDPDTAHSIVGDAIQNFGRIDIIINNAGVVITRDFIDLTPADVDRSFAVHVRGSFLVAQSAWGYMTKAGYGRILNVVSVDGNLFGNFRHTAYDAAKAGLAGHARAAVGRSEAHPARHDRHASAAGRPRRRLPGPRTVRCQRPLLRREFGPDGTGVHGGR